MSTSAKPLIIPQSDSEQIETLRRMMEQGGARLIGPAGELQEIPDEVYHLFTRALQYLQRGQGVSLIPYRQELTTQQGAKLLGVSRQYFVRLLEGGGIPFHLAGTHRRVYLKDVIAFKDKRDQERRAALTDMAREAVAAGVYDVVVEPDE
jgi:excisionase family DNA binding protein